MTQGRAALLPLSSTLHHESGPWALHRMVAGHSLLEQQIALLRATGHAPIVLLGGPLNRRHPPDVLVAESGHAAAAALNGADWVTVLGHGVVMGECALGKVAGREQALLVCPVTPGWERIDADTHWAGALSLDGQMARATLEELGDWDAQATLLRLAVQNAPTLMAVEPDRIAQGLFDGEAEALFVERTGRRLERDDRFASHPLQRGSRTVARWGLERGPAGRVADAASAVVLLAALVAGWLGLFSLSAIAGALAIGCLSVAAAIRRARGDDAALLLRPALLCVAVLPAFAAWRADPGTLPPLLGLTVSTAVLMRERGGRLPATLRLDVLLAALAIFSWLLTAPLALGLLLLGVVVEPLLRAPRRRALERLWRGSGD